MAADAPVFYNTFREAMADGRIDLDTDSFLVGLATSSYTPDAENHVDVGDITNELSGSGYARYTLTATWTRSTDTVTFDADDATFTASGGPLTARYAFIFDDTSTGDLLVCYILLDNAPANVSVSDGNTLTLQWNGSGIFTLTTP